MSDEQKIKITAFVDFILTKMDAREALIKLMATNIHHYEKLKLEKQPEDNPEMVSPYFILINAAMDLGWDFAIEKNHEIIRGLSVGTKEYFEDLFKTGKDEVLTSGGQTGEDTPANS
jgi:hypothetical protein